MKRREFLKTGAAVTTAAGAAGVGGLVGSACGGLFDGSLFGEAELPLPDMGAYLRQIDDGMKRIAKWDRRDDIPETDLDRALENDLGKKALRALYLAGMFGDLPDAGQVHPGMQARIRRSLPEMDEAVSEMAELLSSVSDEDADALQRFLKEKDNPGMELAQRFDEVETALGVSARRRRQTRAFITHAVSRLKNQPPRLLFDEYVGKVERIDARTGSVEEVERELIARMGEQAFWERQQRLAMYAAAWARSGVTAEDVPLEDLPPVELPDPPEEWVEEDAGALEEPAPVEDAGPVEEPLPAPPARPAPQPPPAVRPAVPSAMSCAELGQELQALRAARLRQEISEEEFKDGVWKLKAFREQKRCDGAARPVASPADLPTGDCDKVVRRVKQDLRELRVAARRRELTRAEVAEQAQEIRGRREFRRCQRQKKQRVGLVCLGIGTVLGVTSVVLIAATATDSGAWWAGVIMATPAAVLLIMGLIWLGMAARYRDA